MTFVDGAAMAPGRERFRLNQRRRSALKSIETRTPEINLAETIKALWRKRDDPIRRADNVIDFCNTSWGRNFIPGVIGRNHTAGKVDVFKFTSGVITQRGRDQICAIGMTNTADLSIWKFCLHVDIVVHEPFRLLSADPRQKEW